VRFGREGAMKSLLAAAVLAVSAFGAAPALAADYQMDKAQSAIVFTVDHMGFSRQTGVFRNFDAKLNIDTVRPDLAKLSVTIQTASIDTFDAKRDLDLKSAAWFDVAHYPTITFVATRILRRGEVAADIYGDLTLKGVSRPIALTVALNRQGDNQVGRPTLGFTATGRLKRSDFGLGPGGPLVGDEVTLTINSEFGLSAAWAAPPPKPAARPRPR
jgi:polyisoprenoid-binding protein YceI